MTPEQITRERAKFEAWAKANLPPMAIALIASAGENDSYTRNAWLARAEEAHRVREALEKIAARCPTDHADYTIASIGDAARAALKDTEMKTLEELMALIEDFGHASMELRSVAHTKAHAHAERRVNERRAAVRSALAEVVEGAARYQFLRSRAHETAAWDRYEGSHWAIGIHDPGSRGLDAAIDSARSAA